MNRRMFLLQSRPVARGRALSLPGCSRDNPMPEFNQHRALSFSNEWIESTLVTAVRDMPVEDAIVVNLSTAACATGLEEITERFSPGNRRSSGIARSRAAKSAALLHLRQRTNLGGVALGWEWYGQRNPQFPRGTPLYISPQDDIGDVELDPMTAFGHRDFNFACEAALSAQAESLVHARRDGLRNPHRTPVSGSTYADPRHRSHAEISGEKCRHAL